MRNSSRARSFGPTPFDTDGNTPRENLSQDSTRRRSLVHRTSDYSNLTSPSRRRLQNEISRNSCLQGRTKIVDQTTDLFESTLTSQVFGEIIADVHLFDFAVLLSQFDE